MRDRDAFVSLSVRCASSTSSSPPPLTTSSEASASGDAKVDKPAVERRKRVLSGAQPTGILHLGNYYGALKNYVDLQDDQDAFYTIVDLHAITVAHDPKELREATKTTAALYLAAGVDPKKVSR